MPTPCAKNWTRLTAQYSDLILSPYYMQTQPRPVAGSLLRGSIQSLNCCACNKFQVSKQCNYFGHLSWYILLVLIFFCKSYCILLIWACLIGNRGTFKSTQIWIPHFHFFIVYLQDWVTHKWNFVHELIYGWPSLN